MTSTHRLKAFLFQTGLWAWFALVHPRPARGESAISYKYEDYREADGRIAVQTQAAAFRTDFGPDTHLKLDGVIDAIAGATPNGQPAPAGSDQVVLSQMNERRKAWSAELAHQFPQVNVAPGVAHSSESDYVSTGWSLNTRFDFNSKNTGLLAGVAGTSDDIRVFYQTGWVKKHTNDLIVGVTQLLDPRTMVGFNLSVGRATGYLSDPYKLVQKSSEVAPGVFLPFTYGENRPGERTKWIALVTLNRSWLELRGAFEGSYRFYHDTFGVDSHTVDLSWLQKVGPHLVLKPGLRFYQQNAADFFHYQLDATSIVPVFGPPQSQGPFYSSDYRLSSMRTVTYGLKAVWTISDWLQVDVTLERYKMRGRDGITPQSAYSRATMITGGARISW